MIQEGGAGGACLSEDVIFEDVEEDSRPASHPQARRWEQAQRVPGLEVAQAGGQKENRERRWDGLQRLVPVRFGGLGGGAPVLRKCSGQPGMTSEHICQLSGEWFRIPSPPAPCDSASDRGLAT